MNLYKKLIFLTSLTVLFSFARADVIYENGSFNGTNSAAQISPPQSLSNSFIVADESVITLATLGLWSAIDSQPDQITWSIGTMPFASDIGNGTTSLTSDFQGQTGLFYVYLSRFDLNVAVDPGTYWLTLSSGSSTNDPFLGWDINFGPSSAFYRNNSGEEAADSEYFLLEGRILDDTDPMPVDEPASIAMVAIGLISLVRNRRDRNRY